MALALVLLVGCAEIPAGPTFSDAAERVRVLQGSDPCSGGICWLGGSYHPELQEAGIDLVLGLEESPRSIHLSDGVFFWQQAGDIFAFDSRSQWLYPVWNHTDGSAYDLQVHNGTVSFVTSPNGTAVGPEAATTLWTWNIGQRGSEVGVPMLGAFRLVAYGAAGWVLSPWDAKGAGHLPEAHLLHRNGWVERLVQSPGGPGTVDAAFSDGTIYVAVNQWDDKQFTVVRYAAAGGLKSAVRSEASTGAVGLVAAPGRLAFTALTSPQGDPQLREVRFDEGIEVVLGKGRPVGYVDGVLVANRIVDGGQTIDMLYEPSVTLVGVLPGLPTHGVAVDGDVVVVRVAGELRALATMDLACGPRDFCRAG